MNKTIEITLPEALLKDVEAFVQEQGQYTSLNDLARDTFRQVVYTPSAAEAILEKRFADYQEAILHDTFIDGDVAFARAKQYAEAYAKTRPSKND